MPTQNQNGVVHPPTYTSSQNSGISHPRDNSWTAPSSAEAIEAGAEGLMPQELDPVRPQLVIIQQPLRARVCGFSVLDRRPIHPTPIIKLTGSTHQDAISYIVIATLWSSDMETNHSFSTKSGAPLAYIPIPPDGSEPASLPTPASSSTTLNDNNAAEKPKTNYSVIITDSYARSFILIGSIISECHTLTDTENADGLFFVFHDLAVRTTGSYRLKFEMYDTKSSKKGEGMTPIAEVVSDAFQVYRPADFPGLSETTELSRCFARQGIQIRMKYAN